MRSVLCLALWIAVVGGRGTALADPARLNLPDPVINPHSTEICLNSRISYHRQWSGAATDQMLSNVLHAAAQASRIGGSPVIYLATSANVYIYDPGSSSLAVHKAGDWRSDTSAAFEVGVASDNSIDAGAAMQLAQLESVALWTGTTGQLASCPEASATSNANDHWDPVNPIQIAIGFGIKAVAGFTTTLVAISSDNSLPNPHTDGSVYMDTAMGDLAYGSTFDSESLSSAEISQLLWASYGCSNHTATGKAGLVCPSAVAAYYLTHRIYAIGAEGVYRYHNRRPPGTDATTRDHRIELVRSGDTRPSLRESIPDLPTAPHYLVICVGSTGAWPELEVGFAAMGAVLEASTMGLQGYMTRDLTSEDQAAIRNTTGIPSTDFPMAIVSLGHPYGTSEVGAGKARAGKNGALSIENAAGHVSIRYQVPVDARIDLTVFDCQGHRVKDLVSQQENPGAHSVSWDCIDDRGKPVSSGVYFCCLKSGGLIQSARIVVVR
jgi:hypothetical protein